MKRLTILLIGSIYLLNCGGGKEAVSDISAREDIIARSIIQQQGERPDINPETLNPKVPPQKIISSSQKTPVVAVAKPKEVQPEAAPSAQTKPPVKADTVATVTETVKKTEPADMIRTAIQDTVKAAEEAAVVTVVEEPATLQTGAPSGDFLLQKLTFDDIYFEEKSAMPSTTFNSNYYVTIGKIVKALRSDPEVKVRISGHTDYEGNEQLNYELSEQRATTFAKILVDLFPAEMQADIAQRIEIIPEGANELLVESRNKARRTLNRRVSFELFYGDLQNNPYAVYMSAPPKRTTASAVPSLRASQAATSIQQKLYDKAMMLFNQKRYNEAIDIFEEILVIDPSHSLVDNAHFWIGEAYYYQGRYSEALNEYHKVFGAGNANKEAAAQMRLGYCYFRLNKLDQAVIEFRKVIENYPNASEEIRRSNLVLSKIRNY
ncbi:MAG TPA: tetratricopeptide repeat protein [Candidatus Marinimicrobia bacterium]|nr:tetratricopeptide repeat protein [Candidatus Neomarinimicrobiota bacterium]